MLFIVMHSWMIHDTMLFPLHHLAISMLNLSVGIPNTLQSLSLSPFHETSSLRFFVLAQINTTPVFSKLQHQECEKDIIQDRLDWVLLHIISHSVTKGLACRQHIIFLFSLLSFDLNI